MGATTQKSWSGFEYEYFNRKNKVRRKGRVDRYSFSLIILLAAIALICATVAVCYFPPVLAGVLVRLLWHSNQ